MEKGQPAGPRQQTEQREVLPVEQHGADRLRYLLLPIVILLLANKDLDGKTKKIVSVVAAIALVLASLFSIDFNPVSAEELAEAQQTVGNGSVYWTQFGKSYHLDPNCHTLMRSSKVYQGTIEEAFEANRTDPCDFCALEQE